MSGVYHVTLLIYEEAGTLLEETSDSIMNERTLREIYLPAFETAVKRARPATAMYACNKLASTCDSWTSTTSLVVWRVTERCDLGCSFCRFSRELPGPRAEADPQAAFRFGRLLAAAGRDVLVSWLGGEPTLWGPLWEVSRAFREDFGLRLGITTHGRGLTSPRLRDRLLAWFDRVTVSLDGDAAFHDAVRGAPGLFDRLAAGVSALAAAKARRGRGPTIHANTVLMRANLPLFERICNTAAAWGIEELTFNALGGRDRPGPFFDRERLRPEDVAALRALLPDLRTWMAARGLRIVGSERYLDRLAAAAAGQPISGSDCRPGRGFLFVDELGRVAPCSFTTAEYGVPVEEVVGAWERRPMTVGERPTTDDRRPTTADRRNSDSDILAEYFGAQRRRRLAAACANCPSTQIFGKFDAN